MIHSSNQHIAKVRRKRAADEPIFNSDVDVLLAAIDRLQKVAEKRSKKAQQAEALGGVVHHVRVSYRYDTGDPKRLGLWRDLPEKDKETDRRIGLAVAAYLLRGYR